MTIKATPQIVFSLVIAGVMLPLLRCAGQRMAEAVDSLPRPELVITPRFNSTGHFPYSGALINRHINVDLNVFYEYRDCGFFIFKSQDLKDPHSIVNYLQPGIFRKLEFSRQVQIRLFLGYVFSQTNAFRDKEDSDYFTAAVAYWTLNDRLRLENTALFLDLTHAAKLANRLLIKWTLPKGFRVDIYLWERVVFVESTHATSSSLALNFPQIRLSPSVSIQSTFSYQRYLTKTRPGYALRDGFLLSVAVPLEMGL